MTKQERRERGRKGGDARALSLSPRRRRAIAKNAATARWARERQEAKCLPDTIDPRATGGR
jgi:hypothetical protein